jgi:hypothetical protein
LGGKKKLEEVSVFKRNVAVNVWKGLSSLQGPVLDVVNVAYESWYHSNEHRKPLWMPVESSTHTHKHAYPKQ